MASHSAERSMALVRAARCRRSGDGCILGRAVRVHPKDKARTEIHPESRSGLHDRERVRHCPPYPLRHDRNSVHRDRTGHQLGWSGASDLRCDNSEFHAKDDCRRSSRGNLTISSGWCCLVSPRSLSPDRSQPQNCRARSALFVCRCGQMRRRASGGSSTGTWQHRTLFSPSRRHALQAREFAGRENFLCSCVSSGLAEETSAT